MRDYIEAINTRVVVYDGGMGATLEQIGTLTQEDYGGLAGKCHEALVLNRPDVIEGVHRSMLDAGAEVVETDTFQGSRIKLEEWGLGKDTLEINTKAAQIARRVAGESRFVAGSIGPTGYLPASEDPSLGQIRFGDLLAVFEEQASGLIDGGADLLIIETAQDILEVKAAIFGARAAFKSTGRALPIHASVSLLPNGGKMLLGTDISAVLTTLEALHVDVIGLNCSTGPEDMRDAIRFLGEHCPVPIACIPNAGLPLQGPDGETIFPEQPEPLAQALSEFVERYGVGIVGGCCGTTPEHIAAIVERVAGRAVEPRPAPRAPQLSSMIASTPLQQEPAPTMVGERVNSQGSRKAKELLLADDYDGLVQIAEDQVEGADRAHRRGRTDAPAGQEGLAHPTGADTDRLDRARGDRTRARADSRSRDRQLGEPRGRPREARSRGPRRARARRGTDRPDDRRGRHGEDGRAQGGDRQAHPRPVLRGARHGPAALDLRLPDVHADNG
jgi:5-methyltetrahydrofolate--homocysteine methyltransferase